jgi:hypothetical protein
MSDGISDANATCPGGTECWNSPCCAETIYDLRDHAKRLRADRDALRAEVERLTKALEEREGDMHMRIRAGYDKTVADSWRAEVAKRDAELEMWQRFAFALSTWTHEFGGALVPSGADTYGEGVRACKDQVATMLAAALAQKKES